MIQSLQVLRLIMALVQTAALAAGYPYLDNLQQQLLPLCVSLPWLVLALTRTLPPLQVENERRMLLHLLTDCALLTAMLYLAGGATNPFVSWYLVPIAIAAATLPIRSTALLTGLCLLAYSVLMTSYLPLAILSPQQEVLALHDMAGGELSHPQHAMHLAMDSGVNWHLAGMWLNFGLSALLITWFVTRMAAELRHQQAELAAIREQHLRDAQLLGIATLAAGTVHELATPLSTMAILTEDLKTATRKDKNLSTDMALLAEQVERCRQIVQNLSRSAAQQQSGDLQPVNVRDHFRDVITHWQLFQPAVPISIREGEVTGIIHTDATLEQALINLLNNAAEASPRGIEVTVTSPVPGEVHFGIRDFGEGIQLPVEQLGKPFMSTRGEGRGLGLFLSRAAIERLGGQIRLEPCPEGGCLTTVILAIKS